MYYEVYVDQFFLENFLMMLMLQSVCSTVLRQKCSVKRRMFSSGIAALLACLPFVLPGSFRLNSRISALLGITICAAGTAGCREWKKISISAMVMAASACMMAGALQLVSGMIGTSVWIVLFPVYCLIKWGIRCWKKTLTLGEYRVKIVLEDEGDRWELTGLIDTGNHLTEPLTGRAVSILDRESADRMPRYQRMQSGEAGYYYIPYHSVGITKSWMMGMVIDKMYVTEKKGTICVVHPVLAVSAEKVCLSGEYQMIIHPMQVS